MHSCYRKWIFTVYHLLPLPISKGNNTYMFIKPQFYYLIIASIKIKHSSLNSLSNCKILSNHTHICLRKKPLYNTNSHSECHSELLMNHIEIPHTCDIRISFVDNEIGYQLTKNKNKWIYIYIVPQIRHITIDCDTKFLYDTAIVGTGFLSLTSFFKVYTRSVILIPSGEKTSSFLSYNPDFYITLDNNNSTEPIIPSNLDFRLYSNSYPYIQFR